VATSPTLYQRVQKARRRKPEGHQEPLAPPPEDLPPELLLENPPPEDENPPELDPLDQLTEELVGSGSRGMVRSLAFSQPQWRQRSSIRSRPSLNCVGARRREIVCDLVTTRQRGHLA
jgi:hypothetical protein